MKVQLRETKNTLSVWWCISKICNFNCPYCLQRMGEITKFEKNEAINTAERIKQLFDKCQYKNINITFSGGEPSLYDLHKIIDILSGGEYNLRIYINTNFSLHDIAWWNSLKRDKNIKLYILASCHLGQLQNLDSWLDKAAQIDNFDDFKVKFVITNDNFEETKEAIKKCVEKNIKYCLEGARGKGQKPLFNEEIIKYIKNSNFENELSHNKMYKYGEESYTQTELLLNIHKNVEKVKCKKRVSIRGNMIESGCPYKLDNISIYDLEDLDWVVIDECDCVNKCSLCQAGELEF